MAQTSKMAHNNQIKQNDQDNNSGQNGQIFGISRNRQSVQGGKSLQINQICNDG